MIMKTLQQYVCESLKVHIIESYKPKYKIQQDKDGYFKFVDLDNNVVTNPDLSTIHLSDDRKLVKGEGGTYKIVDTKTGEVIKNPDLADLGIDYGDKGNAPREFHNKDTQYDSKHPQNDYDSKYKSSANDNTNSGSYRGVPFQQKLFDDLALKMGYHRKSDGHYYQNNGNRLEQGENDMNVIWQEYRETINNDPRFKSIIQKYEIDRKKNK